MPNLQYKLASNSVIKSLGDFTNSIDVKISDEIKLVTKRKDLKSGIYKNCTNLALAYCTLNTYQQKQSIIYKALKKVFKPSNYRLENDKENTEDIISEALYLLRKSAIKFLEKDGQKLDYNFDQFAIVQIREGIKSYKSKWNNLNGSDRNELIHSAIRAIKKRNCIKGERLNYKEAKHLANHFNLCKNTGYKVIWDLEGLHFEKKADWKKIDDRNEEVHVTENFKKGNCLPNNIALSSNLKSFFNTPELRSAGEKVFINDEKRNTKKVINQFINHELNSINERIIFKKRLYCEKNNEIKLKHLSSELGISVQRISVIEKKLKNKFKIFFSVEKQKSEGIN